jgi:propionyl-CoA synthetase
MDHEVSVQYSPGRSMVVCCRSRMGRSCFSLQSQGDLVQRFSQVVGHSYGCYGPLLNGSTSVVYEGKPVGTPDASTFFRVINDHKVAGSFWSPTALRIIRQNDPEKKHARKYPMVHLRALFLAGEHCDRDTLLWARDVFGSRPVIDHYWQTETGAAVTAVCLGFEKHPVSTFR